MIFRCALAADVLQWPVVARALPPGKRLPRKRLQLSGFLTRADSIRELARQAGIDADGLAKTVSAIND